MDAVATTAPALLRALAPHPWPTRCVVTARTARALAGRPELSALVDELRRGDWYSRQVALRLAVVAGDATLVAAQLGDGTPGDRVRAAAAAVRAGVDDATLAGVVAEGSAQVRRVVVHHARRAGRTSLSDALLPVVRARSGDRVAARLLGGCSAAVARAALPDLAHAVPSWTTIARRHLPLFLDHVEATAANTPERARRALPQRFADGLLAAAWTEPARVTAWLETLPVDADLRWLGATLAVLARADADRVAALLTRPGTTTPLPTRRALWKALLVLPDDTLGRLGSTLGARERVRFLTLVPPRRRAAVLATLVARPDADLDLVDLLPAPDRAAAARREAARRETTDHPARRRAVTARLPFAEAEPDLRAVTRDPSATVRAEGYPLLIRAAAATRDPEVLGDVLASLTRLRQEQDPVRAPAVRALAAVPGERWPDRAGPALVAVVEDAVRARDVSHSTRWAARDLVAALLRAGARDDRPALTAAGLGGLTALSRTDPYGLRMYGLVDGLPRGVEHRLWPAFAERIAAEARVGEFATAIALASSLDRRAWNLEPLQHALGEACAAKDDATVRAAVPLWLAPPAPRGERVEVLLRRDRTIGTVHPVADLVARHRTDLLGRLLQGGGGGRFLRRDVRILPAVGHWWRRWTAADAAMFLAAAAGLARDTRASVPERASGLRELRGLPGGVDVAAGLLDDPDPSVAMCALVALGGADEPARAVGLLLPYLATDRAREATPTLRGLLAVLPAAEVGAPLAAMLAAPKVTVRKEAVRLVATLRPTDAVAVLRGAWDGPHGHRDVRRAAAGVLPDLLDDPAAWALLDAAVADPATADAVLGAREDAVAPRHRAGWARRVSRVATSDDDTAAALALDALATWARYVPEVDADLVNVVTDLGRTARWRPAAHTLVRAAVDARDLGPVTDAVARLLPAVAGADLADDVDAGADRDRPALRRVAALVDRLTAADGAGAAGLPLGSLVDLLAAEPRTAALAVSLAVAAADEPTGLDLPAIAARCTSTGLVLRACRILAAAVGDRRRARPAGSDLAAARAATGTGSTTSAALPLAWLALTVVAARGPLEGWSAPWRDLLRTLRRHADPDLARTAAAVVTAAE